MKNLSLLLCSLLLNGVFGDTEDNVSVKEGDSVTLQINPEVINRAEDLLLWFNDTNVAKIDLEVKDSQPKYTDGRFRDRLNLDRQTGSLNITHITSKDTGEYKLEIIRKDGTIYKTFRVFVIEELIKVSVMEGDSITLKTGSTAKRDDVKWKLNGTDLTDSNHEVKNQTGDLNIVNIRRDQSGDYRVEINGRGFISHKTYSVKISDEVESVSVIEGDDYTLHTDATRTKTEDVIEWKFKNSLIAYSNKTTSKGRFHIDSVGSLIITNIRSEDSGLYDVYITGSKIIHKRFKVTVTEPSQSSHWTTAGPVLAVVLLLPLLVGVLYVLYKRYRKRVRC
ncbi:obscurin-like isoform X2 [Triplophysa dalaica]|uniref:obscurin-like isoform X2 n=1 Tax=Triplophysa dalaica TaxID=1582913 RepID=UPI0024DF91E9|nr:obscurin-like isoform X2 [Triplophysa dalaica]